MIRIRAFVHRVVRSHLGHVLLAISWSFILFRVARPSLNQPQFVDCFPIGDEIYTITSVFHVYPIWVVIVAVAHFPAMFVTAGVTKLAQVTLSLSCAPTAKLELPLFALFSAIQWFLVGYMIESLVRWWRTNA